jgi:hypothetical protein
MSYHDELEHRARQYTQRSGLVLGQELGRGVHGIEVQAILRFLEGLGVFMVDVNAGNISFDD